MAEKIAAEPAPTTTSQLAPAPTIAPAPGHAPPGTAQVDKLTDSARAQSPEELEIDNAKLVVMHSFTFMNDTAQQAITDLKAQLEQEDEPPFADLLLKGALNVALLAGGAAAGELIAGKLLGGLVSGGEVKHEFVKGLFEQGIGAGVQAGGQKLSGKSKDSIASFISSQKAAVRGAHLKNQNHWINVGRHKLRTSNEAKAVVAACDEFNMNLAGQKQYVATRDAWVGYLAQSKYGSVERMGSTHADHGHSGPTLTNVSTQATRDQANRVGSGRIPEDAPDIKDAVLGRATGVLEVVADLPEIDPLTRLMNGKPEVRVAILSGVNGAIRREYEGRQMSEMNIPRQIVAKVDGDVPNFTINIDEAGNFSHLAHAQSAWLVARSIVAHPENANRDDFTRKGIGLRLLLEDLVPSSVRKKL